MGESRAVEQLHAGEGVATINRDGTIGHDDVLAIEVGVGDADGSVVGESDCLGGGDAHD